LISGLDADRLSAEFSISAARQINEAISARRGDRGTGEVIGDRYHARPLTSPRAVRNTLAYVLNNYRHHGEDQVGGRAVVEGRSVLERSTVLGLEGARPTTSRR